jgi:excinuclease ABC subunit C
MLNNEFLQSVPHDSGIYMMLDKRSTVLYVGKAKDLYKRLASYFRFTGSDHSKTTVMLRHVHKINTIITHTEKEALILEASLIKKHKPKYNIILRDDKNYPYIRVTLQETWPRVHMTRRKKKDGAKYFGPYSSSSSMWATLKLINSLFPLRRCKGAKLKPRKRPCLNLQLGRCLAPCAGDADHAMYKENVQKIILLLEGKNKDLISNLTNQMEKMSKNYEFEKAAVLRDKISAINKTTEKQIIVSNHTRDQDIFGFFRNDASVSIAILFIRSGAVTGSRNFFQREPYGDDSKILSQVINQFYFDGTNLPSEIIIPFKVPDLELFLEHFSELSSSKVHINIPQRGDKIKLIELATKNAEKVFSQREKKEQSWLSLANTLQKKLHLKKFPDRIECLDISNISGKQAVGSLVHFYNGEPDKSRFRHFKIATVKGPDDYAMMEEVLTRRLSRGIKENNLPDLFVVDGGKGQLSMALRVADALNIRDALDWVGIAKEREEEGEKLYKPGRKNAIILPFHNPALLYLMRIRDESHRFGVTFHRKLRNKATLKSTLDDIPGVGPQRKKDLLRELGSLKQIKLASIDQLSDVSGIGKELAQTIYDFFHQ